MSGVLASFPVSRFRGATVVLVDADGRPLPLGTAVVLQATGETFTVGYDGQVFFPQLQDDNEVSAQIAGTPCVARFAFDDADAMSTLGPFRCLGTEAP